MTITELMEKVAERTGSDSVVAHGFVQSFLDIIIERLDAGDEVKIRGLGTFQWVDVPSKTMPATYGIGELANFKEVPGGRKLKFFPAKQFKSRRS